MSLPGSFDLLGISGAIITWKKKKGFGGGVPTAFSMIKLIKRGEEE